MFALHLFAFLYETHGIATDDVSLAGKIPEGLFVVVLNLLAIFPLFYSSVNKSKTKMGTVILRCCKVVFLYKWQNSYYKLLCF